jgi:hypothetical protein
VCGFGTKIILIYFLEPELEGFHKSKEPPNIDLYLFELKELKIFVKCILYLKHNKFVGTKRNNKEMTSVGSGGHKNPQAIIREVLRVKKPNSQSNNQL